MAAKSMNILFLIGFVDHFAVSLIIPSLPIFVKSLHSGPLMVGFVTSLYGSIQLFSSPIVGSLSDIYGRRSILLVSVIGAFVGYIILGLSTSIIMVLLSRIPCGLFKHTSDTMKLCVTDDCPEQTRASTLGKLNAFSSLGFMLGPALGGFISSYPNGFHITSRFTAILFLLNYGIIYYGLPKVTVNLPSQSFEDLEDNVIVIPKEKLFSIKVLKKRMNERFQHWKSYFRTKGQTRSLLVIRLLLATAAILFRSHFMLVLEGKFHVSAENRGYILSYMGFLAMCSSFLVGPVVAWSTSEVFLLQASIIGLGVSLFLAGCAASLEQLLILLIPQLLFVSLLRACMTSVLARFVRKELLGGVLGISSSLTSIARIIAPMLSGALMEVGYDWPAFGGCLVTFFCSLIFWYTIDTDYQAPEEKIT